jgi:hypothetical protein
MKRFAALAVLPLVPLTLAVASPSHATASQLDIARGVVASNGSPIAGATVHSFIWPNSKTLAGLADGAQVPTFALPSATTTSAGQYFVPMSSPGSIPAMYKEPGSGAVSVETDVISGGSQMVVSDSEVYNSVQGAWLDAETSLPVPSTSGTAVDFGTGTMTTPSISATGDPTTDTQVSSVAPYSASQDAAIPAVGGGGCVWNASTWHYGRPEHFTDVNAWHGGLGRITESTNSSHTLGVGATSDSWNHMSANGTATISLSKGVSVSQGGLNDQALYNKVNDRDFNLYCSGAGYTGDGRRRPVSTYSMLDGSLQHSITHTFYYSSCQGLKAGATFHTTNAKQHTFSNGFDIGPFNVSAQAGFGSSVDEEFVGTVTGFVCGSSQGGPVQSGSLDSRSFK